MIRPNATPNRQREGMSPAAWCVHAILTSPSARKRGVSSAQEHVLRACAKVLQEHDRQQLAKLGHAEALDRHCRVQAQLDVGAADAQQIADLEIRKERARQAVEDYAPRTRVFTVPEDHPQ